MLIRRRFLPLAGLACAALLATTFVACHRKTLSGGGTASALRVGMELAYRPFEMQDAAGNPDGVSVRMAEALAAHLGRPLEIVPMGWNGLIPALQTGHVDLVISSMSIKEERLKQIDFSEPYGFTGLALLVRKGAEIKSIDDLKAPGKVVAVKSATTSDMYAIDHLPNAKRIVFEDDAACVQEVIQGRADAFIYDQLSIFGHARDNPDTTEGLLRPFIEESWAIGVAKGNDALRQQVNQFLVAFRADQGFEKLADRYLKDEKRLLEEMGVPFILR
ncbi:MAG: transporter substrate-binding domain-containing protein [Verrucomicrobiales bacterium]